MDRLTDPLKQSLQTKEERRHRLAKLPYPEKVRILVHMQRMAFPLSSRRNPRACVWRVEV